MILALTAVSALFVGLVAIVLYKYKRGGVDGEEDLQQQQLKQQLAVQQWVAERDLSLPSVAAVLRAINNSRTDKHTLLPSEEVCSVLVTVLVFLFYMYLSLPSLTHVSTECERIEIGAVVTRHITACLHPSRTGDSGGHRYYGMNRCNTSNNYSPPSTTSQSLVCDVEWPNCVPGLLVSVVRGDDDETTTYRLQVDYLKMKVKSNIKLDMIIIPTIHLSPSV